ncbi:MAG: DNA-binding response regulator [Phycisphaeraceae bacterium]|nr:DNA-binding response regulator [Phycisphaeraceae bacterium]
MAGKSHILVVEDELHLATGIRYNLEAEGYRVTVVADGASALRVLESNDADIELVVLDLMLPGMSGYTVCESIRARDTRLPVLIVSARTLAEDRARGFDVGANQYITKPFDLDEFLSRVRNLLSLHGAVRQSANDDARSVRELAFGDANVNFDTFEARVGDRQVRLTRLEMSLLRYFAANEGRVVPRQELLTSVWGMAGEVNTRAPDQFIRRLRKTFEPDPGRPKHFLTIRDAGYRFVANPDAN